MPRGRARFLFLPFGPGRAHRKPPPWPAAAATAVSVADRDTLGWPLGLACVVRDRGVAVSGSDHFSTTPRMVATIYPPERERVTGNGSARERGRRRAPARGCQRRVRSRRDAAHGRERRRVAQRCRRHGDATPLSAAPRQQTREATRVACGEWSRNNPLTPREREREGEEREEQRRGGKERGRKREKITGANDIFADAYYRRLPKLSLAPSSSPAKTPGESNSGAYFLQTVLRSRF